ncbi:hypothetical protein FQH17_04685 [Escherichia coli]|nr:hypothetical protein [Escherichia coli]EFN5511780.1 hypothetical protein [Escherichia coli]
MSFHQSATTKNLFCHKAGGSSFSGCQCYFPTYWLGLFRSTAVMQKKLAWAPRSVKTTDSWFFSSSAKNSLVCLFRR